MERGAKMSATNRGSERFVADFYATPLESIYAFLDNYELPKDADILEPSAGNGNIIKALRDKGYNNNITAIELRYEEKESLTGIADNVVIDDFLKMNHTGKYDVVIGNPPFSKAQEFIDKSLELLTEKGKLIFLLRTNFLESQKRYEWWQSRVPNDLYVLSKRPSFTGKGTDATSYSWYIWDKGKKEQSINIIGAKQNGTEI